MTATDQAQRSSQRLSTDALVTLQIVEVDKDDDEDQDKQTTPSVGF